MKYNRLTAALLTAALTASLSVPVGAATSSFTDITDQNTAIHADVLRLMGVVDGVGANQFNPQGTLTRGAFCKMLVSYMGLEDKLPLYSTRTIFNDVPASHWAAPYINLAASTASGEEGMLIAGVGDGTFQPDSIITYAQAVTILIRVLGYTDSDTGGIWPMGYLNLASSIGLTQGLWLDRDSNITRSQAAQLFVQALSTEVKGGGPYYETMGGSYTEDVMVLATNVESNSGIEGAIRTSVGTYLPETDDVNPISLQGRRGVLVINNKQELVTFLPDESTSVSLTLSESAQATYLMAGGKRYSIGSATPVFSYGDVSGEDSYANQWTDLASGTRLTIFMEKDTVIALYVGDSTVAEEAIVVSGTPTRSTFYALTGGRTDFNIMRNGQEIGVNKIATNDVVTYDSTTNTLVVSGLRISVVYESGSPNTTTPTSIHALGHDFPVLDGALEQSDSVKLGDTICLLLTADGSVAAIKKASSSLRSTVYGIAGENSVEAILPSGGVITLSGSNAIGDTLQNRLVTASSHRSGEITASRISSGRAGDLNVDAMTLGDYPIVPDFALYEQVMGGATVALTASALDMDSISGSDIAGYRLDASGNVDIIILNGVTGDGYTYGKLIEIPAIRPDISMDPGTNRMVTLENSGNGTTPAINDLICSTPFETGDFGGVTVGMDGRAGSLILLENKGEVSRSDFFTAEGKTYVKVNGASYEVSNQVECYNRDRDSWMTLSAIRAYSNELTIYIDPLSDTVRVIATQE